MKRAIRPILCAMGVASAVLLVSCAQGKGGGSGGAIAWREDVDKALAEAKAAGKPAVIDFHADW